MKVRDLIELLYQEDQNAEVVVGLTDNDIAIKYGLIKDYIAVGVVATSTVTTNDGVNYSDYDEDYCSSCENVVEIRHALLGD